MDWTGLDCIDGMMGESLEVWKFGSGCAEIRVPEWDWRGGGSQ